MLKCQQFNIYEYDESHALRLALYGKTRFQSFIRRCQSSIYSKICLKRPLKKKTKIGYQDQLLLNAGQKYCRMLQRKHSAILSTFIKLKFVIKILLSIFEWPLKTGLTVRTCQLVGAVKPV